MTKQIMTLEIFLDIERGQVVAKYDGVNGGKMTRPLTADRPLGAFLQGIKSNFPWASVWKSSSLDFPEEHGLTAADVKAALA